MTPLERRWHQIACRPVLRFGYLVAAIGIYISALQVRGGLGTAMAILGYFLVAAVIELAVFTPVRTVRGDQPTLHPMNVFREPARVDGRDVHEDDG
jgi:hypothetical protein